MSDEKKPSDQQSDQQPDQPAQVPAPIVGGGASDLRQMKEEAI